MTEPLVIHVHAAPDEAASVCIILHGRPDFVSVTLRTEGPHSLSRLAGEMIRRGFASFATPVRIPNLPKEKTVGDLLYDHTGKTQP